MNGEDVEKLELELVVGDDQKDLMTGKPAHYAVGGLPSHLQARIAAVPPFIGRSALPLRHMIEE